MTPGARITSRHLNQLVLHEVHECILKQRDDERRQQGTDQHMQHLAHALI